MEKEKLKYWVGFTLVPGIGRVRFSQLENYFGDLEKAWKATPGELRNSGLDSGSIKSITTSRPGIDPEAEMKKMDKAGVSAFYFS